jgi:GNAT superfamily N-acetyltransferase
MNIGEQKSFFILPEYQNQGIGTELFNHAINFADQKQLKN